MTIQINNSCSWGVIPPTIIDYLDGPPSTPLYFDTFSFLTLLFATKVPQGTTYLSTSTAFCNRVAVIIDGYDNEDRLFLIAEHCKHIWHNIIKAEDRILDLLNQKLFQFVNLEKIETILYRSLIDIALSPFKCRFLDRFTHYLITKKVTLFITEGPSSAFIHSHPHPGIRLQTSKEYCCYENEHGERYWQTPSMEEVFLHECLHHYNGHIVIGHYPIPLGAIWHNWDERQVICGDAPDGSISEFCDRSFADSERAAVRIGHCSMPHSITHIENLYYSIRYGCIYEVSQWFDASNFRATCIQHKLNNLKKNQIIRLLKEGRKAGRLNTYKKFFQESLYGFDVNSVPPARYNAEFDHCNSWLRDYRVEQTSIDRIKLNHIFIRQLLNVAQNNSNLTNPEGVWRTLARMLNRSQKKHY